MYEQTVSNIYHAERPPYKLSQMQVFEIAWSVGALTHQPYHSGGLKLPL